MKFTKKIGTKLAVMALATAALTGVGVAADIPGAEAANAGTITQCRIIDAGQGYTFYGTNYRYAKYCHVNYDWFEEVVLGYRDGYKIIQYYYYRPY